VDRFEIIGELGKGGMATVHLAEDRVRGERVALKILHEHLADDPDARARLIREVRAATRIQHPNALVAFDIHDLDGRLALSMPVHRGLTLAEHVAANGPMNEEEIRELAIAVCGALGSAHAQGVVHRDVTPNNILVGDGPAVLADFGLARLEGSTTRTAAAPGTWGYTAPEVYQGETADPRSDLYGLGAALYLAATGKAAYATATPAATLKRQLDGDHVPLTEVRPDLPSDLREAIEGLLRVDPDLRPLAAREVEDALSMHEAPMMPSPRALTTGLPLGMYTLIVQQRRSGSDARGLADAVGRLTGAPVAELPPEMALMEFKVVEGVNHDTVETLAAEAIRHGYVPRIVNDPRVRYSNQRGQIPMAMGAAFLVIAMAGFALKINGDTASWLAIAPAVLGAASFYTGVTRMRLKLAFDHLKTLVSEPIPDDPILRMQSRTNEQLDRLEAAMVEVEGVLTPAVIEPVRRASSALRERAAALVKPAQGLAAQVAQRDSTESQEAVARIHKRLKRIETLASAGETVDEVERHKLRQALDHHADALRTHEESVALRTRIAAQLLEIGAAATRATRALRRDLRVPGSVSSLLEQLERESAAAAEVLEEVDATDLARKERRLQASRRRANRQSS